MNTVLSGITGKLADRWLAWVLTPGLLLVVAAALAIRLGQSHALDATRLDAWITTVGASPAWRSAATLLLAAVGTLAASVATGLAAAATGDVIRRFWVLPGRRRPGSWLRARRLRRWSAAEKRAGEAELAAAAQQNLATAQAGALATSRLRAARVAAAEAVARRDAICLIEPARPTWIADRLRAAGQRVMDTYGLDLNSAWPRLWSLASEPLRADLAAAQTSYIEAARLVGWGLLYLLVGIWWWPSVVIAVAAGTAGWIKARESVSTLADLAESAVDLYGRELADHVGLTCTGLLTPDIGERITALLRREATGAMS